MLGKNIENCLKSTALTYIDKPTEKKPTEWKIVCFHIYDKSEKVFHTDAHKNNNDHKTTLTASFLSSFETNGDINLSKVHLSICPNKNTGSVWHAYCCTNMMPVRIQLSSCHKIHVNKMCKKELLYLNKSWEVSDKCKMFVNIQCCMKTALCQTPRPAACRFCMGSSAPSAHRTAQCPVPCLQWTGLNLPQSSHSTWPVSGWQRQLDISQ